MNEDKMELEKAKKYIRMILRQKDLPDAAKSLGYAYAVDAIETVLHALKKLQEDNYRLDKENQKLFEININSISKKKAKSKIREIIKLIEQEQFKIIMGDASICNRIKWILEKELLEGINK